MTKLLLITLLLPGFISCKNPGGGPTSKTETAELLAVKHPDYELSKPTKGIERVLILFGGYHENANDIKR